jgi:hypothetical protein
MKRVSSSPDSSTGLALVKAVLASSHDRLFPPVDEYVDGGVGSYANPCYVAAYESSFCLGWKPEETTLLSFGTGRGPAVLKPGAPQRLAAWDWLDPVLDGFLTSASDQQVRLVETFFKKLDFRRFQVDMAEVLEMETQIPLLVEYGAMGRILMTRRTAASIRPTKTGRVVP